MHILSPTYFVKLNSNQRKLGLSPKENV